MIHLTQRLSSPGLLVSIDSNVILGCSANLSLNPIRRIQAFLSPF